MIVTTTNTVEGRSVAEYLGLVFGEMAGGTAGFRRTFFGGYDKAIINARNSALNEMCANASNMGADAVVGVSVNYSIFGDTGGLMMVTVTGTAVRLA